MHALENKRGGRLLECTATVAWRIAPIAVGMPLLSNQSLVEPLLLRVGTAHELRTEDLAGFGFAAVPPDEIFRKISQNLSPAGVTSPFMARPMPTDCASVVPMSGR